MPNGFTQPTAVSAHITGLDFASEAAVSLSSDDGLLAFSLSPAGAGVHVRRHHRFGADVVSLDALLRDGEDFQRYCEADEMRGTYPGLFCRLRSAVRAMSLAEVTP